MVMLALLRVAVLGCRSRAGISASAFKSFRVVHILVSWRVREHRWRGFRSYVLWISYILLRIWMTGPASRCWGKQNILGNPLRIYPIQDCLCLATNNSKDHKQGQGWRKGTFAWRKQTCSASIPKAVERFNMPSTIQSYSLTVPFSESSLVSTHGMRIRNYITLKNLGLYIGQK